jgi:four helix bundle protein
MKTHGTFEDLECWKAARELRQFVVENVVRRLPVDERFRLCSQLLDAARSGHNNIAEGHGRFHFLDKVKFLSNARGSVTETLDHVIDAVDEGFVSPPVLAEVRTRVEKTIRLINGYAAFLRRSARAEAGDTRVEESPEIV